MFIVWNTNLHNLSSFNSYFPRLSRIWSLSASFCEESGFMDCCSFLFFCISKNTIMIYAQRKKLRAIHPRTFWERATAYVSGASLITQKKSFKQKIKCYIWVILRNILDVQKNMRKRKMEYFWKDSKEFTGELVCNRDESDDNVIEVIRGN